MTTNAIRGDFLHCLADPGPDGNADAIATVHDGLLLVRDGRIEALQPAATLLPQLGPDIAIDDWRGHLIVPGFIDCHVHYPQVDVIASHGTQLLDWLERYTFPEERKFADAAHADATAEFFLDRLLENGTTTAAVFCTVHAQSAESFFAAAQRRNLRMIAGKVLMDRNCPEDLRDSAETGYRDSKALIGRWHRQGRLGYAITPRVAPTSTPEHLAEVAWARQLFPEARSYLDVYDRHGLLRERAIYGHCIWLDDADRARMASTGTAAAFCPTSNLFLGSGLFNYQQARAAGMRTGLATDVGGGTSYSLLTTMAEGYKVQQLLGTALHPMEALYLATLGGARSLGLEEAIGNFMPRKEADLVVLNPAATPALSRRNHLHDDAIDRFFALMHLGDERAVAATYTLGQLLNPP